MPASVNILELPIAKLTFKQALTELEALLQGEKACQVSTVNAEFVVAANQEVAFRQALLDAKLLLPDGIGILWAAKFLSLKYKNWLAWFCSQAAILLYPPYVRSVLPEKISGADLFWPLMQSAATLKKKVFFLGAAPGVAEELKRIVEAKMPEVQIVGAYAGSPAPDEEKSICELINQSGAELLLVAYSFRAQEQWISRNLKNFKTVRLAMGLGGTFDFVVGHAALSRSFKAHRAPVLVRKLGLESFWRLLTQPYRFPRVWTAVVKFPLLVYRKKTT